MKRKIKLLTILVILISIKLTSCDKTPIPPDPPYMVIYSPDSNNVSAVKDVNIAVFNLVERYYDISFILEGRDDTRERNIVYLDTFVYYIDMNNKEDGGQTSFMINIDVEGYGVVTAKLLENKIEEFIPPN